VIRQKIQPSRLYFFLAGTLVILGAISWRLYDVAWRRHDWYAQTAAAQASGASNILLRGNILLSDGSGNGFLVATNRKFHTLNAVGADLTGDPSELAHTLAAITGADVSAFLKVLEARSTQNRVVMRRLTDEQAAAIKALDEPGISVGGETDRTYPAGTLAADAIGFLGYGPEGRAGQYGVESSYEQELSGRNVSIGASTGVIGNLGTLLGLGGDDGPSETDRPHDVELTIDKNIQAYAERALAAAVERYQAASGLVIVQEPMTGRILAMADSPSFDPNFYGGAPTASFLNAALMPFEPGSSFKPFTMAMGLDLGKITPETSFNDEQDIVVDGYTIKNFNEQHFGRVTMTKVLEKSINAGTMYVQSLVSNDQFLTAIVNAGFGQKTGVDLPGESSGDINNLYTGRRINFMTASFGQGITVTPLQLINGYSAIANGGKLMRPYVVEAVTDERGERVITAPEVIGTPFRDKTAAQLQKMLVSVVDNGFDKARIPRYDVAGKTGTAQIASPDGGYLEKQYNHSFVGFAPASAPRFTILIKLERPQGVTFAADSLSPVFKDISLFLLNYLSVPPTR
jgi:stage V sporulation protein D (sporulation-specific penicillin-binding protein)